MVRFYAIIQMRDAVINNYQLLNSYENLVQKHEKMEMQCFSRNF